MYLPAYRRVRILSRDQWRNGIVEEGMYRGWGKIQFRGLPAAQLMIHRDRDKTRDKHREEAEIDRSQYETTACERRGRTASVHSEGGDGDGKRISIRQCMSVGGKPRSPSPHARGIGTRPSAVAGRQSRMGMPEVATEIRD